MHPNAFLVLLQSLGWVGGAQGDLFMQEWMNIEQFAENSVKGKLIFWGKLAQAIGIARKVWWERFLGGDFIIFRHKVRKIFNFE